MTRVDGEAAYAVTHGVLHSQCYFWRVTEGKGLMWLSCSRIQLFPGENWEAWSLSLLGSENSRRLPPCHHPRGRSNSFALLYQAADPSCPIPFSWELLAPGSTVNGQGECIMLPGCLPSQSSSILWFSHCHLAQWMLLWLCKTTSVIGLFSLLECWCKKSNKTYSFLSRLVSFGLCCLSCPLQERLLIN